MILAALVIQQISLGPIKPPGTNANLHEMCRRVEQALEAGQFEKAQEAWLALPSKKLKLEWDETLVPPSRLVEFRKVRDDAIFDLEQGLFDLDIDLVRKGDLRVTFSDSLPNEGAIPKGAVFLLSPSAEEPRVEAVIGLRRGANRAPVDGIDVYNEIGHAVMRYFGREPSHSPSDLAFRTDTASRARRKVGSSDRQFYRQTNLLVQSLKNSIDRKIRVRPNEAKAAIDVRAIELGNTVQGKIVPAAFQVTNNGNGLLLVAAKPDCGCLFIDPYTSIEPGATALIRGLVDSHEYVGALEKNFLIQTNDPEKPALKIPVRIKVEPLFRILAPGGATIYPTPSGVKTRLFFTLNAEASLHAISAKVAGLPAVATLEPWSGKLADPEMGEGVRHRKGYKVDVELTKAPPNGRFPITVLITTDSKDFPVVRHSLTVQTGIVALPGQVYLGEITRTPRRAFFYISRPGRAFKVLAVKGNSSFITGKVEEAVSTSEYRISVALDGRQPVGGMKALIRVTTDDPTNKVIEVPILGSVR